MKKYGKYVVDLDGTIVLIIYINIYILKYIHIFYVAGENKLNILVKLVCNVCRKGKFGTF